MSTYSVSSNMWPSMQDFAAEDEPTIVINGSCNKEIYDQQAPAPASDTEVEIITIDNQAR